METVKIELTKKQVEYLCTHLNLEIMELNNRDYKCCADEYTVECEWSKK